MAAHWSQFEIAKLKALAQKGYTRTKAAAALGRDYKALCRVAKMRNIQFADDVRVCPVCGQTMAASHAWIHLGSHGIRADSDDATIAKARQVWQKILTHRAVNRL